MRKYTEMGGRRPDGGGGGKTASRPSGWEWWSLRLDWETEARL